MRTSGLHSWLSGIHGLRFSVDNRVLIPRPGTELVEKVLSILETGERPWWPT